MMMKVVLIDACVGSDMNRGGVTVRVQNYLVRTETE